MVVSIARWLVGPGAEVWLVSGRVQVVWMGLLMVGASDAYRPAPRFVLPDIPRLMLLSSDEEAAGILHAWARVTPRQSRSRSPQLL